MLFADNYYSTVVNAQALFEQRGLRVVMTKSLRERKTGKAEELDATAFPFGKPPNTVATSLPQGWLLQAETTLDTLRGSVRVVATLWKDSKLIGFIATALLGNTPDLHVDRRQSGGGVEVVRAFEAAVAYADHYGAVHRVDHGAQVFPIDFRQVVMWYKRPGLFVVDVTVNNIWGLVQIHAEDGGGLGDIVCYCQEQTEEGKSWRAKVGKEATHKCFAGRKGISGREKFQFDLGTDLIALAAEMRDREIAEGAARRDLEEGARGAASAQLLQSPRGRQTARYTAGRSLQH